MHSCWEDSRTFESQAIATGDEREVQGRNNTEFVSDGWRCERMQYEEAAPLAAQ